jgi:hypothetical protein
MRNYVITHYAMKAYEGSGDIAPPFLTSALDGEAWSASRPYRFGPGDRVASTHCVRGWVGSRTGLDAMEQKKVLSLPGLEPRSFSQ